MDSQISIKRQNRKSLLMRVTLHDGIVVFIPNWMKPTDRRVRQFIADGLRKFEGRTLPERVQHSTKADILRMVEEWALRVGVQPARVQMRKMYSRWGSCSSRDTVTLNTALYFLPPALAEYVVCHELVHLRVFNHGPEFKAEMTRHMPDWRERERALKAIFL